MTWFKVDDTLSSHPKARAAGLPAMGLWVVAGAYAGQYLTEGFVPDWYVESWPSGKNLAARLVDAGLWERGEGGWMFHQWGERQPTKQQVEAEREKTRERQQRWRDAKRDKPRDTAVSNGTRNGVTNGVTNASPTRPDPTVVPTELHMGAPSTPRRSPEHPIPDDWQPTPKHRAYAAANGLDLDREAFKFRNHAHANDRRQRQWDATFTTWLAKATEYAPKRPALAERTDLPECWR